MKHFDDLTDEQKSKALDLCVESLVGAILETGQPALFLSEEDADKVEKAIQDGERMQSPWFDGERIFEAVGESIRTIALEDAKGAIYLESGEYTVKGLW